MAAACKPSAAWVVWVSDRLNPSGIITYHLWFQNRWVSWGGSLWGNEWDPVLAALLISGNSPVLYVRSYNTYVEYTYPMSYVNVHLICLLDPMKLWTLGIIAWTPGRRYFEVGTCAAVTKEPGSLGMSSYDACTPKVDKMVLARLSIHWSTQ